MNLKEDFTPDQAVRVHYMSPEELETNGHQKEIFHDDVGTEVLATKEPELPPSKPSFTPYDAVMMNRQNPDRVLVTKHNNNYYIHIDDLKDFMKNRLLKDYDSAVGCITKKCQSKEPDMCPNKLRVLMGASDLEKCSEEDISKLENADIIVEVYKNR